MDETAGVQQLLVQLHGLSIPDAQVAATIVSWTVGNEHVSHQNEILEQLVDEIFAGLALLRECGQSFGRRISEDSTLHQKGVHSTGTKTVCKRKELDNIWTLQQLRCQVDGGVFVSCRIESPICSQETGGILRGNGGQE